MPRILLLMPSSTWRAEAFLEAARVLGVDVTCASEEPSTMAALNPAGLLTLPFSDPSAAARDAVEFATRYPIDAVVAVDTQAVIAAAAIGQALSLPHNSASSAAAAVNKYVMRKLLHQGHVPSPTFRLASLSDDIPSLARSTRFPCVIKPLALAASQGVMRANDEVQLAQAIQRLERILSDNATGPSAESHGGLAPNPRTHFLIEEFVAGPEFAIEGLLTDGDLRILALFDKPDPLDGPFFEETIYVTPSRLSLTNQVALLACAQSAAQALGLNHGPVHIELRLPPTGPVIIELNPRTIGGQCSRVLRFGTGMSLEEVVLRHAVDPSFRPPDRQLEAAGVMMIPIPKAGTLRDVGGLDAARSVSQVVDVRITAHRGQRVIPLPEGGQYLGFIFARAATPEVVEHALRAAHAGLAFEFE